ncbi:complex I subunit 4 family protein [Cohnella lupini]|uniref:Proton-translocating NADH-quinone oxidoreductase chain M n=1 Tax=Cohnella lupini TaxID=1294267 RepID=A0A3D9I7K1_9BACL|nr:NADH-quinone oxidoreductase subunit M [Cohnella lupini]RED57671.1 proton-translocating NADH-quinone oxidoreductase chain M [Cohnella lupini]
MLDNLPVLSLITFTPLAGALLVLLLPGARTNWLRITAIIFTVIPLLLSLWLFASYQPSLGGGEYAEHSTWLQIPLNIEFFNPGEVSTLRLEFDYNLAVDGISMPMVLLTSIISVMSVLASVHIRKRWKTYYFLFLLLLTGIYGVFLARDLILFFVFFEVTLIPMFFLIGIWGYYDREKAATRFLIYNGLGSAAMLLSFLIIIATLGFSTTDGMNLAFSGNYDVLLSNLADPNAFANVDSANSRYLGIFLSDNARWTAFVLLLIAFGIKIPIFPFHTWMLKVHTEAPPAVVMIHSGILLKMGVYGLIRFVLFLFPDQMHSWATTLAVFGVINILYGAILACVQRDFKLVLAYSSISHMGIVLLGIASFEEVGLQGAIFQSVSHGLISALLFLIVGSLYERTNTTQLSELGGLAKTLPFMSGILLIAGLASLGLPGLSGFVGEFLSFMGLFGSMKILTAIGVLGILFAAVYVLRSILNMTYGPMPETFANLKDARFVEAFPMITLAAFIVLLGVYPSILTDLMQHGFNGLLEQIQTRMGG